MWTQLSGGNIGADFTTAVGSANMFADVDLTVKKASSFIDSNGISGKVILRLKDTYDFNAGKTFTTPGVGSITSDEIYQLIKCLGARNFNQDTTYSKVLTNAPTSGLGEYMTRCQEFSQYCRIRP